MSEISMQDVRKRISYLTNNSSYTRKRNMTGLYERAIETGSPQIIEECINNWESLHENRDLAFTLAIELFEKATESCNEGTINKLCNFICEETVPKVRDGAQTQTLIKHKLARIKTKITTKINNNIEDMKNAASNALSGAKSNLCKNIEDVKSRHKIIRTLWELFAK